MFNEQRQSQRKVLKVRAHVVVDGFAPVAVRTVDISSSGMCIVSPDPIQEGANALLRFDLSVDGNVTAIEVRSRASYCILSHGDFKVGFNFLNLSLSGMTQLAKFMR
ncbi:PilZ domain-containing protein [Massilia pseudoviolaceinigra]|uniref:PilZ domain-containing protein n=1 Tax=Massilia pseudoviolaceinigra TaxID=3057165 RepID=UPI0027969D6B|nr:PilZ domain-containing protein [Massilia sp. CCM 9206]MDQ1920189.1 PilZ domain-containing protein [Massilia sp. CCM 9206]